MSPQVAAEAQRAASPARPSSPSPMALSTPPRSRGRNACDSLEETPVRLKAPSNPLGEVEIADHSKPKAFTGIKVAGPTPVSGTTSPSAATAAPSLRADAAEFVPGGGWPERPVPSDSASKVRPESSLPRSALPWSFPPVSPPFPPELAFQLKMMQLMDPSMVTLPPPMVGASQELLAHMLAAAAPATPARPTESLPQKVNHRVVNKPISAEESATLSGLRKLDACFEPFSLQHDRLLLAAVGRGASSIAASRPKLAKRSPWTRQALSELILTPEDIRGLGADSKDLLERLDALPREEAMKAADRAALRHISYLADGHWKLRAPPEIRRFVSAGPASRSLVPPVIRMLLAEQAPSVEGSGSPQSPPDVVSVLSYSIAEPMRDRSPSGQQRRKRLLQQLRLCRADVICLQGLDPERGAGPKFTAGLQADGYDMCFTAKSNTSVSVPREANCVLWRKDRWECLRNSPLEQGCQGSPILVADFSSRQDSEVMVRVICMKPQLLDCALAATEPPAVQPASASSQQTEPAPLPPCIVAADLAALGGAEDFSLMPLLAGLHSVSLEVLGEDMAAPLLEASTAACGGRGGGLRQLWRPDTVLFRALDPICILSGHTEGYLKTMPVGNVQQQFPAGRLPLVAAFSIKTKVARA